MSTAERLVTFFDHSGYLGISELILCLNGDTYRARVLAFRVSNVSLLISEGCLVRGNFCYIRNEKQPLEFFIKLAQLFEMFTIQGQREIDALCLDVVRWLNASERQESNMEIDVSFG